MSIYIRNCGIAICLYLLLLCKTLGDWEYNYIYVYVTGSGKSFHLHTKSEFNFIAQDNSYTKDLSIHSVSTVQC